MPAISDSLCIRCTTPVEPPCLYADFDINGTPFAGPICQECAELGRTNLPEFFMGFPGVSGVSETHRAIIPCEHQVELKAVLAQMSAIRRHLHRVVICSLISGFGLCRFLYAVGVLH